MRIVLYSGNPDSKQTYLFYEYLRAKSNISDIKISTIEEISKDDLVDDTILLLVGALPETKNTFEKKVIAHSIHLIQDKYSWSGECANLPPTKKNISKIIMETYKNGLPKKILVNNSVMKQDFGTVLGQSAEVTIAYHPVTDLSQSKFSAGLERKNLMLFDSPIKVDFNKKIAHYVEKLPYKKIPNFKYLCVLNYRPGHTLSLSRWAIFFKLKKFISFNLRYRLFSGQYNGEPLDFLSLRDWFFSCNTPTIESRWKPGTKLTVAIGAGLPLVSQRETSIHEIQSVTGWPIHYYINARQILAYFPTMSNVCCCGLLREKSINVLEKHFLLAVIGGCND